MTSHLTLTKTSHSQSFPITAAVNISRLIVIFTSFGTFLYQGGGHTGIDDVY